MPKDNGSDLPTYWQKMKGKVVASVEKKDSSGPTIVITFEDKTELHIDAAEDRSYTAIFFGG